ncbi:MAG TPA: dethiobiotin synthase, partial [Candidatus Dormibacteraeota bacterium]|nr:dethiobiotin synthase [Candidatus Dormibacteraeota bacterium]
MTGTDTGVGKTVLTAGIAAALRREGVRVDAVKPVATGVEAGEAGEDAELLARATGQAPERCAMVRLALPRSPLAAAGAAGTVVDVDALVGRLLDRAAGDGADLLLAEGVGGLLVPLTPAETVVTLVRRLGAPVLVAARAGLGTINHTALTVLAARQAGVEVLGVVLLDVDGGCDPAFSAENARTIAAQCDVEVLGVLRYLGAPADAGTRALPLAGVDVEALAEAVGEDLDLAPLRRWLAADPAPAAARAL